MKKEEFVIPIAGLKEKVYHFEYEFEASFFETADEPLVSEPKIQLHIVFDKTHEPYVLDFEITGEFKGACDRCGSAIKVPVLGDHRLFVEFGEPSEETLDDSELIYISRDDHQLELEAHVRDFAILSLPMVKRCSTPDEKVRCNKIVEGYISNMPVEEDLTDPRWEALKKLKQKGNGTS